MSSGSYEGVPARYWRTVDDDRIECFLCPRRCVLRDGQRAFCFVRQNQGGALYLTTYGRSSGFCIDPIEKKPLNHFYPGTAVLSFGTAGCNLGCKFCQNWDISKARQFDRLQAAATPQAIADAALRTGCTSVAYTYNDPVIFAEYAIDVARECRSRGIKNVAVTAGYISPEARPDFFRFMDAANVDLKAFTEEFYRSVTLSHLEPVLDTLRWLRQETEVWIELTTLLIPGDNDSLEEIGREADWIAENLGEQTPLHFTAFHPDFKMTDVPPTPPRTLLRARDRARASGLKHVYTGNIADRPSQSTYCASCGALLIERAGYRIGAYQLAQGGCAQCGAPLAGRFAAAKGDWGARRLPVAV
jgi:pyruvate formate lyase activating enzyme